MGKSRTVTKKSTRVARTRGAGRYTEAQFWGMIRAALRDKSRYWPPTVLCKKLVRRKTTGYGRYRYEYKCDICSNYFPGEKIEVHHKVPVGKLSCIEDLEGFVDRLFCEVEGLVCLCSECHLKITKNEE